MRIELTSLEARVIGCLVEKEILTPAQYPLSLNALTNACNQKSSRDPVMDLSETEVQKIVDGLVKKHLVSDRGGFGSRVVKYQHRFGNAGFGSTEFSAQELGVLCLLLLRGPQTAGELRSRSHRLCDLRDADEAEAVLSGLIERRDGPFVARLAPEPGRREPRYMHLFTPGEAEPVAASGTDAEASAAVAPVVDRWQRLEAMVLELRQTLDDVQARLAQLEHRSEE